MAILENVYTQFNITRDHIPKRPAYTLNYKKHDRHSAAATCRLKKTGRKRSLFKHAAEPQRRSTRSGLAVKENDATTATVQPAYTDYNNWERPPTSTQPM